MKTASLVLGIIGGVLISIFSLLFLFGAIASTQIYYNWDTSGTTVFFVFGIGGLILAALGIVGGTLVRNHNIAGGVLLIIAAVISMISFIAMFPGIMFLIAAIFAFIKENPPVVRAYPQQPYYSQPPQHLQPQYPQPQQPQPQQPQNPLPPKLPGDNM